MLRKEDDHILRRAVEYGAKGQKNNGWAKIHGRVGWRKSLRLG